MTKDDLIDKIANSNGNVKNSDILNWVRSLPSDKSKSPLPTKVKIGDVFMHPIFGHPYVVLAVRPKEYLCGLLTTEAKCPEILEACSSRFFGMSYFTNTLFTVNEVQQTDKKNKHTFYGVYDNNRHLKVVLTKLKQLLIG